MTDTATLERQLAEAHGEIRELEALLEWTRREVRRETVMPVKGGSWTLPEHEALSARMTMRRRSAESASQTGGSVAPSVATQKVYSPAYGGTEQLLGAINEHGREK